MWQALAGPAVDLGALPLQSPHCRAKGKAPAPLCSSSCSDPGPCRWLPVSCSVGGGLMLRDEPALEACWDSGPSQFLTCRLKVKPGLPSDRISWWCTTCPVVSYVHSEPEDHLILSIR